MTQIGIKEASKLTGLPTKTIRFYEQEGLLRKVSRSQNNYREYSNQNIEELRVINYARNLHFSIPQIKSLLHNPNDLNKFLQNIIVENKNQINSLTKTQKGLEALQKTLKHSQQTCTNDDYCCNIFYQTLKQKTKGGENK